MAIRLEAIATTGMMHLLSQQEAGLQEGGQFRTMSQLGVVQVSAGCIELAYIPAGPSQTLALWNSWALCKMLLMDMFFTT